MVTPPFVSEVTDAQIVAFFRDMVPLSRTGVLVYNAPGIGITLSPSTLEQLADISGVVGVKQGDLSPTAIDQNNDDYEFIEIKNIGSQLINLLGAQERYTRRRDLHW